MALDPTARKSNVKDSIKKFFIDNLSTIEGVTVSFDTSARTPKLYGQPKEVIQWISVDMGSITISDWSNFMLLIYCCTRKDYEGFKLAQLRDKVLGYLTPSSQGVVAGGGKIPFYRSYSDQNWTIIGGLVVLDIMESDEMQAPDETKYVILTCRIGFVSKI